MDIDVAMVEEFLRQIHETKDSNISLKEEMKYQRLSFQNMCHEMRTMRNESKDIFQRLVETERTGNESKIKIGDTQDSINLHIESHWKWLGALIGVIGVMQAFGKKIITFFSKIN